ncbi:efflux RND transporter periplasmic adaptor subunit [Zavarzinella formosa]|uniref:efflux RND transporter periplasmic adaptor subunit n=1 Tax=Zavarzinella formosa TaxID=360055 RepID=UPI0002FA36CA|nr:hypothetical protein [Zavarzinella formosa]
MFFKRYIIVGLVVVGGGAGLFLTRSHWLPLLGQSAPTEAKHEEPPKAAGEQVFLSSQAQQNLKLAAKPLKPDTYWKTISVPGQVIDRPGRSDRGIVAPVSGIVTGIHRFAGDSASAGDLLFTLRILSEGIQLTQTDLFKTTQDIKLAEAQRQRLTTSGAVAESRLIEADNQITRLRVAQRAYRQELINRGLSAAQIDAVADGKFVNEIRVSLENREAEPVADFEIQEVKVELGQQVVAGSTLCLLSNHRLLAIEGRAFRDETPLVERTFREGWPVAVDFREDSLGGWEPLTQPFLVGYIANTIDPDSRTFAFRMPLENQPRTVERDGRRQTLWRFRPGQRVRLSVRVEKLDNVFVLPADAVVREGGEAYVFRQNGDVFERKPVRVLEQDRERVVIANDGSVPAGLYVAHGGAAQLNRMIKAQSSTLPKGFHIHADGSVHMGSHD